MALVVAEVANRLAAGGLPGDWVVSIGVYYVY